jgi:hypothetical protein
MVVAALLVTLVGASLAAAQTNPTNNSSDVTGPSVTGGDVAGGVFTQSGPTGTMPALATPAVQLAVVGAADRVTSSLTMGSLPSLSGALIPPRVQAQILAVLTESSPTSAPAARLSGVLTTAGARAAAALPALMTSLAGLASNPSHLAPAIGSYNQFVSAASARFLANPPPEFLAVQSVLSRLTIAAAAAK